MLYIFKHLRVINQVKQGLLLDGVVKGDSGMCGQTEIQSCKTLSLPWE